HPGVTTISKNADRDIAFEDHAVLMGIIHGFPELQVQMELDKVLKSDRSIMTCPRRREPVDGRLLISAVYLPLAEVRRAMFVSEITEGGIRDQPVPVLFKE